MKTKVTNEDECLVTVRLPPDLAQFIDGLAAEACNTRAGVVRLAVKSLRQAMEARPDAPLVVGGVPPVKTVTEGAGSDAAMVA